MLEILHIPGDARKKKQYITFMIAISIFFSTLLSLMYVKSPIMFKKGRPTSNESPAGSPSSALSVAPTSTTWIQVGEDVKGPAMGAAFLSGSEAMSISLSSEGTRMAIGFPGWGSEGQVHMYQEENGKWSPLGFPITAQGHGSNRFGLNAFGVSVSISSDGNFVAIGDKWSSASGSQSGSVFVFQLIGGGWTSVGSALDGNDDFDLSGFSVSLSSNGRRVAVGSPHHDVEEKIDVGKVSIFELVLQDGKEDWKEVGSPLNGVTESSSFGSSLSLSNDGTRIAIGAPRSDIGGVDSGMVKVFDERDDSWKLVGQIITGQFVYDLLGSSLSLSGDGRRLAIAAPSNTAYGQDFGHVEIFELFDQVWIQLGTNIDGEASFDESGFSISLSEKGNRVAIGSPKNGSGKARIFQYNSDDDLWIQVGPTMNAKSDGDLLGFSVSLSGDGNRISIAAPGNDENGVGSGHVRVFDANVL